MVFYARTRSDSDISSDRNLTTERDVLKLNGVVLHDITRSDTFLHAQARWYSKEMKDNPTPGFHRLKRAGHIINTPMVSESHHYNCLKVPYSFHFSFYNPAGYTHQIVETGQKVADFNSCPLLPLPTATSDLESAKDQAVTQAWSNVKLSETQALVSAAEAGETISSMFSIARRIIKVATAIKNLNGKVLLAEISPKELSDRYMEFRYSLRPLVGEIANTMKAINSLGVQRKRLTFRGAVTDVFEDTDESDYTGSTWFFYGARRDQHYTRTVHSSIRVRAGVLTETWGDNLVGKFGLLDIPESMWELVPFSFVADWFFNIGAKVAAFSYNYGLRSLASWVTVETVTHRMTRADPFWTQVGTTSGSQTFSESFPETVVAITVKKERVPNPELQVLPSFNLRMNYLKLLDLIIMGKNLLRHL